MANLRVERVWDFAVAESTKSQPEPRNSRPATREGGEEIRMVAAVATRCLLLDVQESNNYWTIIGFLGVSGRSLKRRPAPVRRVPWTVGGSR